jgi:hypothetical protein
MLSKEARKSRYRRKVSQSRRGIIVPVLAALALAVSGAIVACSDNPVEPDRSLGAPNDIRPLGPLTVATAGDYHNAFLDFSFPRVRHALASGGGEQAGCRAIAQAMREFVLAVRIPADPHRIGDQIAGGRCSQRSVRKPDPGGRFSLAGDWTPSPGFDAMVAEMEYAVEAGYSVSTLTGLFDQKVAYARANFPAEEANVIEAAASVGISSVEYWNANYDTQLAQLQAEMEATATGPIATNPLERSRRDDRGLLTPPTQIRPWRAAALRVGKADLKGAVHGGISGIRGGWQGILAGAVIEGGSKSAGALLSELFK